MNIVQYDDDRSPQQVLVQGYSVSPVLGGGLLRQVITILFKWKWLIVGVFLAIALPVVFFSPDVPARYQANARLMIKQERAYLAVTASDLERVSNFRQSTLEVINSEMQIIRSREVIEEAINALQLRRSVGSVQGNLTLYPVRDSKIIQLSLRSFDPDEPVALLNKIVDTYLKKHASIHNPEGVVSFLEQQVARYQRKAQDAVYNEQAFENRMGIANVEAEITAVVGNLSSLQSNQTKTELDIKELQQRIDFLQQELPKHPRIVHVEQRNPLFDRLRQKLADLQLQRDALLEHHRAKHPRVLEKEQEIQTSQAYLASLQPWESRIDSDRANPMFITLNQQLLESQTALAAAMERQRALDSLIVRMRAELRDWSQKKYKHRELEEAVAASHDKYLLYQKKLEEARISEAMDREKLLNVGIVEHAAHPAQYIPPRKKTMNLLLAAFTGIVLGICAAVGLDFLKNSITNEQDLEKYLELPVLAAIELVPTK